MDNMNLILELVNKNTNTGWKNVPHKLFGEEFAVIFRLASFTDDSCLSHVVTNEDLEALKLTVDELYEDGLDFLRDNITVIPISKVLERLGSLDKDMPREKVEGLPMYVVSTTYQYKGAAAMLLLSEVLGSNASVIPSSVHEILVCPEGLDAKDISQFISFVNKTELEVGEALSDQLYFYDAEKKDVRIAA